MVNPSTMRLGIASILIGLVGAWGVRTMMDEEEPLAEKAPPQAALVPLAATDLPEGRTVRRGDIGFVEMTQKEMEERGWQTNLVMTRSEDIIGRQLRKRISLHSPFLTTDLYLDGDGPGYKVRDGYRAAQVTVDEAFGGHVKEGATVDLFFTSDEKDPKNGKAGVPKKTIKVVSAVPVLEVWHPNLTALQRAIGYHETDPTFTLEVEPTIATNINTLRDHGRFSMVERPPGDVPLPTEGSEEPQDFLALLGIDEPVQPPPTHTVWTTEYYKGGSAGAKQFPVALPSPEEVALAKIRQRVEEMKAQGVPEKQIQAWFIEEVARQMAAAGQPEKEIKAWREKQLAAIGGGEALARGPTDSEALPPAPQPQPATQPQPQPQPQDRSMPRQIPEQSSPPAVAQPKAADPFIDDSDEVLPR